MPAFDIVAVREVRPMDGGRLWLSFSDGVEGIVDPEVDARGGLFGALRDPDYFGLVAIAGHGIGWPNGVDLAPEWLHERLLASNGSAAGSNDDGWGALRGQLGGMPEISRFFGIVIRMFFSDHARPHFHAEYGEFVLSVEIDGDGVHGTFPPARLPLLFEWRDRHRDELLANWERLQRGEKPSSIAPLE